MLKLAIVLMTLATPLAAQQATPLAAQQVTPSAAQEASAATATPAPSAAPAAATKISASAMASDPRMIAAIRHANAAADIKCGVGVGANVDLATRAEAQRCRRRMIETAKLDAEGEIEGH